MIQRVELSTYWMVFGGEDPEAGWQSTPCSHTLFVAHDEGFEYRSERFNQLKDLVGKENDDIDPGESGIDGFTDDLKIDNALKLAVYQPAPVFFGAYYGFAPDASER